MHLIPSQEDVIEALTTTGALRKGHYEYSNGLHANEYLQPALALRQYQTARMLGVGLSRKLRANPEIRAIIPQLSIVAPATAGLPVAYAICEALRAHQVYWAEKNNDSDGLHFRQYVEVKRGEQILMVDDILRTGRRLTELKKLIEGQGGQVVGIAVMVYQPNPRIADFSPLPLYYLAELDAMYYKDADSCELCRKGVPVEKVEI
ncbi:MAG: phosphoribosyltransferase [Acidobacteria bacterium]|nr:phosphoribosyltransferase [Acidobacteriota bacterium]